jgi:hypothetical protein
VVTGGWAYTAVPVPGGEARTCPAEVVPFATIEIVHSP